MAKPVVFGFFVALLAVANARLFSKQAVLEPPAWEPQGDTEAAPDYVCDLDRYGQNLLSIHIDFWKSGRMRGVIAGGEDIGLGNGWHVHEKPGKGFGGDCGSNVTGAHFNPGCNTGDKCVAPFESNPCCYAELAQRFGAISTNPYLFDVPNSGLQFQGSQSIVGRSIVVHGSVDPFPRLGCCTINSAKGYQRKKRRNKKDVFVKDQFWKKHHGDLDRDHDGKVSQKDFDEFYRTHKYLDTNNDGRIDRDELANFDGESVYHPTSDEMRSYAKPAKRKSKGSKFLFLEAESEMEVESAVVVDASVLDGACSIAQCGSFGLTPSGQYGNCFCDSLCHTYLDCCSNKCTTCPTGDCACPATRPTGGARCSAVGATCQYDKFCCCPNDPGTCVNTTTASCVQRSVGGPAWVVTMAAINCDRNSCPVIPSSSPVIPSSSPVIPSSSPVIPSSSPVIPSSSPVIPSSSPIVPSSPIKSSSSSPIKSSSSSSPIKSSSSSPIKSSSASSSTGPASSSTGPASSGGGIASSSSACACPPVPPTPICPAALQPVTPVTSGPCNCVTGFTCGGFAVMTKALQAQIEAKIVDWFNGLVATQDRPGAVIGGLVRYSFHEFGRFDNTQTGLNKGGPIPCLINRCTANLDSQGRPTGPNSCILPDDDKGLEQTLFNLETLLYKNDAITIGGKRLDQIMTRGDCYYLAVIKCIQITSPPAVQATRIINFLWGRPNCPAGLHPPGILPHTMDTLPSMMALGTRLNLDDDETNALIGAHTVGNVHKVFSGHRDGHWDLTPGTFDNDFYKQLLGPTWVREPQDATCPELQYQLDGAAPHTGIIMLPSDLSFGWCVTDQTCNFCSPNNGPATPGGCDVLHTCGTCPPRDAIFGNGILAVYSTDENFWFSKFKSAMEKMSSNGLNLLAPL